MAQNKQSKPVIFNCSPIANANEIVNIQGHGFGNSAQVFCSINDRRSEQARVINAGNDIVHAQLPSTPGLYGIRVVNHRVVSDTVYINRARPMHFDTAEVIVGGTFRIFGRNLCCSGFKPRVSFVSASKRYEATVTAESSSYNCLSVRTANIPSGTYPVSVSNGMGSWSAGKALCPQQMVIASAGPDTFKLGVAWSAKLTFGSNIYDVRTDRRLHIHAAGDGIHNDQPAIQNAIDMANAAGGGVVYLPAGTYKMQSSSETPGPSPPLMKFACNVVVQGAGQDSTKIVYGFDKPDSHFCLVSFWQANACGLCDLSIENLNQNDAWLNSGTIKSGGRANRLFLARVKANISNGARIELEGDRILVANCDLRSRYTLLFMSKCTRSLVRNNTFTQMLGVHLDLTRSEGCVVEHNVFALDANRGQVVAGNVRHGMAIGFAHNLAIINNKWSVFNGTPAYNNDGESILSEGGAGDRTGEETGTIVNVKGNEVQSSKNGSFIASTVIAIIHGKGTGQWKTVTGRSGSTITVDSPWTVTPDSSSNYSIFIWSNQNTTIAGNNFTNWLRGIWFYQGSTIDTQISNNHFHTMDGIFLEPCQNIENGAGQFNPIWNTVVDNNSLTSSASTATEINLTGDLQKTTSLIGTMALNNQIYDNEITGTGAKFFENDPACTEGYCNYLRVEASLYNDQSIPAMLGTLFQGNSASNCAQQCYLINGGDYQTTIAKSNHSNGKLLTDSTQYWNTKGTHSSIGTVVVGDQQ